MFPTRPLLVELEKKLKRFSKTDLTLYFSDFMDHMNKICETLDEYTETIEVFKDADYLLSSYRANRTVRTLAILFAIGLPFLVVAGIYFMLPGRSSNGNFQIFWILLVILLVIIGITLYSFHRRKILLSQATCRVTSVAVPAVKPDLHKFNQSQVNYNKAYQNEQKRRLAAARNRKYPKTGKR